VSPKWWRVRIAERFDPVDVALPVSRDGQAAAGIPASSRSIPVSWPPNGCRSLNHWVAGRCRRSSGGNLRMLFAGEYRRRANSLVNPDGASVQVYPVASLYRMAPSGMSRWRDARRFRGLPQRRRKRVPIVQHRHANPTATTARNRQILCAPRNLSLSFRSPEA